MNRLLFREDGGVYVVATRDSSEYRIPVAQDRVLPNAHPIRNYADDIRDTGKDSPLADN